MIRGNNRKASLVANNHSNCELLTGAPIIEICDLKRILVENHRGIIEYSCNEIRIKARYGCICVCGNCLKLSRMSKTKLVITGKISGVSLQGR